MATLEYIFISNPRTGTVSLNALLGWGHQFNHCPATMIRKEIGASRYESLFSFGLVRHPLDRLVSWFLYHQQLTIEYHNKQVYAGSFEDWVLAGCPHHWQYTPHVAHGFLSHPLHQWEYFYDGDVPIVDYIGRYEDMEGSVTTICAKIGLDPERLPASNLSEREKAYLPYFDARTRDAAVAMFRRDFELFGYEP